jgi:hypothetical protein
VGLAFTPGLALFEAPKLKALPSPFLLLAPPQTQALERRASQIAAETEDNQEDQEARKEALYNIAHTTGRWYSKNLSLRLSVLSDLLLDFFLLAI